MNTALWISALIGYLLGSIPSAVWFGKWLRGKDVREYGSKNAGLTNTIRVFGWKVAIPVTAIDLGKGISAPLLAGTVAPASDWAPFIGGIAAIIGHSFTCFAQFRGGKGVLTALGVFLVLAPHEALLSFAVFLAVVGITRYVSLGSILAVVTLMTALAVNYFRGEGSGADLALLLTGWTVGVIVVWKHRGNIQRLRAGTESRFGTRTEPRPESESLEQEKGTE